MEKTIFGPEYRAVTALLFEFREKTGITQVDLANKLGVTQSYVSKVERGERLLDVIQLREFCKALDTDLTTFVKKLEKRLSVT